MYNDHLINLRFVQAILVNRRTMKKSSRKHNFVCQYSIALSYNLCKRGESGGIGSQRYLNDFSKDGVRKYFKWYHFTTSLKFLQTKAKEQSFTYS
jgi:hypothetical protein